MLKPISAAGCMLVLAASIMAPQGAVAAGPDEFEKRVGQISGLLRICGDYQSKSRLDAAFGSSSAYTAERDETYRQFSNADRLKGFHCGNLKNRAATLDPSRPKALPPLHVEIVVGANR